MSQPKQQVTVDVISDPNWYWAWPAKRRIEAVIPQFADRADFTIRFQPFQLYPDLPKLGEAGEEGVDKREYFRAMGQRRSPAKPEDEKKKVRVSLKEAWAREGLELNFNGPETRPDGLMGNSSDSQRLILLAREQGREDGMIEAVYTANHVRNEPLSDRRVLLACAAEAGVAGAEAMLRSGWGAAEVRDKQQRYLAMGIHAVPVLVLNEEHVIHGAPEKEALVEAFGKLLAQAA